EQKELIETDILAQVAKILKVPVQAIENFDEEQAINIISNNASFDNCQQPAFFNNQPTFNPIDKMVELYERMLLQQKEMIDKLEKLIQNK
ncbi:XRE family transcriptional regulator, partial [Flavobacterium sp. 22659]